MSEKSSLFLFASVALFAVNSNAADLPVYKIARTSTPIAIDGKLDDAAWAKTESAGEFVVAADRSPAPAKTEAKLLFDDQFIYFSFRCTDENIQATFKNRDQNLWEEEVVEIFLQPDPAQKNYIELEVNPLNTMLDIYLIDVLKAIPHGNWNSAKLKWAVQVSGTVDGKPGDKEWTCEIALPMEDIVTAPNRPPKPGDEWRLNLYRIEKLPKPALLAWSPTDLMNFHVPEKFGRLVFTDRVVP